MISRQLELGLAQQFCMKPRGWRRGRSGRAHWWFEQMREAASHARDWPLATPRPTGGVEGAHSLPDTTDGGVPFRDIPTHDPAHR